MTSLTDVAQAIETRAITGIIVEVTFPETEFGGVLVEMPAEIPIQVVIDTGDKSSGGGGGGDAVDVPATTNVLVGDGSGGITDSGVAVNQLVQKNTSYPTPTTLNEAIACLKAAGLCAP